jgi:hypothetical protein
LERRGDSEFSKERPLVVQSFLETEIGDLLSSRVNLAVVIPVYLLSKDLLGCLDVGDIFSDTGSNQMVLEPTIRSFNLPLRLGRKGISDFHIAVLQDLFPLRGGLIGQDMMFSPDGVSSLDESEDGMRIDIVGERKAISKDDGLESLNMRPRGLFLNQGGIKDEAAMIIQRGDEIPFLLSGGGPEMKRGVVLDEFSYITGQDLSVMGSPLRFLQIKAMLFGSINDGRQGDLLTVVRS